ncbi:PH domain-containing protein [Alkalihalobacterium chitinilyticum]|uniref:PH domain-containing protein n=1 Tax=Alkalihalobacterium chitinilyticum TaxID=2980103 RepID=A0ABT5VD51_9BACI|nr:PH domain-containing protein [Alkalihalobacterium chitinilyticum]MDE5413377.1 PH domain-containing protein [Alkalihalobacterium chitinilyticum]
MHYRSKKDLWLGVIIWATILVSLMMPILGREWIAFVIAIPIAGFMMWLWFGTGYLLAEQQIKVKYGPFKKTIKIGDISKINKSKNPLSAPALSINRLEIVYGKFYDFTLISPVNEREFILELLKENPNIQLDEKVKEILGKR